MGIYIQYIIYIIYIYEASDSILFLCMSFIAAYHMCLCMRVVANRIHYTSCTVLDVYVCSGHFSVTLKTPKEGSLRERVHVNEICVWKSDLKTR